MTVSISAGHSHRLVRDSSVVLKTNKDTIKRSKDLKNATRRLLFNSKKREVESLESMRFNNIWLPWKRQVV